MYLSLHSFLFMALLTSSIEIRKSEATLEDMSEMLRCALKMEPLLFDMEVERLPSLCLCGHKSISEVVRQVDGIDQCCTIHDRCYYYANLTGMCLRMNCSNDTLGYGLDESFQHEVYCGERYHTNSIVDDMIPSCYGSNLCNSFACHCDLAFSLCLQQSNSEYGSRWNKSMTRKCLQQ